MLNFNQIPDVAIKEIIEELGLSDEEELRTWIDELNQVLVFEQGDDLCDYLSECMPSIPFAVIGIEGLWVLDCRE